jgi:serine protease Do
MLLKERYSSRLMRIALNPLIFLVMAMIYNPATVRSSDIDVAKSLSNAFAAVAKEATPAVVSIRIEKTVETSGMRGFGPESPFGDDFMRRFFGGQSPFPNTPEKFQQTGLGSGFIISKDGYILTNNHVVGNVDKITVELKDGRKFENAKVIGTDPDTEVAVIKIEGENFPVLPLGDSDAMRIGDWVMAIGNPFGLAETVTVGVVSAVGRSNVHIAEYENFIQTDAAINPGNSGGPLINLDGQAIGINTAIFSESGGYMGIGFAIPINMAKFVEEQLIKHGKITRGYLGLLAQDVTPEMAEPMGLKSAQGVIVAEIVKDSPADKAGLKVNDVIVELNGQKIANYNDFRADVAKLTPESKARLTIIREGKNHQLTVAVGEKPSQTAKTESGQPSREQIGLQVQNLTPELARQFGYALGEGVIVSAVVPSSEAESEGIQAGDLILSVDGVKVTDVNQFIHRLKSAKNKDRVLLLVKHEKYSRFVVLKLK